MHKLKLHQAGETIIEVLLALLILSFVMGISYASARRSLKTSQEAQERTVASQMAQSTIEVIKAYAELAQDNPALEAALFPAADTPVCVATDLTSINTPTPPAAYTEAGCARGIYRTRVLIHPILPSDPEEYEYIVTVNWDSSVSANENQVIMKYRWARYIP